jgi:hypothetical protein
VIADSFANVLGVFRGQRFGLDEHGGQALWFACVDDASDMEITPQHFRVRMPKHHDLDYSVETAAGVMSFLLADSIDTRIVRTRITPRKIQAGRMPGWTCPSRHVLAEAWTLRVVVRLRTNEDALDEPIPDISKKIYVKLSHACTICHEVPERYRVLSDDSLVCMGCGASSARPRSR